MTPTTCTHLHIKTWVFEDTHEPAMWSCVDCGLKFAPEMATLEAGREQGLREAREVCEAEQVADTGTEGDVAYNMAIGHCTAAIKQLEGK